LKAVEFVQPEELVDVIDNPQEHDIPGIKESIKEFGYMLPIIVNLDGRIVGGHGRKTAVLELREEGYDLEGEGIPVLRGNFTEREATVLLLGLNQLQGTPDPTAIGDYINRHIAELDMELEEFTPAGFQMGELEELATLPDDMAEFQQKIEKEAREVRGQAGKHLVVRLTNTQAPLFDAVIGWILEDEEMMESISNEHESNDFTGNALFHLCEMIYSDNQDEIGPIEEPDDGNDADDFDTTSDE
jgi:hypothetical protein